MADSLPGTFREPLLEPLLRRLRVQRILPHLPAEPFRLLDVGCGHSAALLRTLEPRLRNGLGIDQKAPDTAALNSPKLATLRTRLDSSLPLPDNTFDAATLLAVIEHLKQPAAILAEIRRVLIPGGVIVLTAPSTYAKPVLEFLAYRLHLVSEAEIRDHKRYFTRTLYQDLARETAMDLVRFESFQLGMNTLCVLRKPAE